jgi:Family of unknown function (DUF6644)
VTILLHACQWLGDTSWSIALRESLWVYPIVETIHVLGLCLFLGLALLLDLRLLNLALRRTPVTEIAARVMPWTWAGFALMIASGAALFYSDPVKFYGNTFFRVKVGLLVLAGINAWVFHATVYKTVAHWDTTTSTPARARLAGALSLLLWAAVVVTGRLIAYDWF